MALPIEGCAFGLGNIDLDLRAGLDNRYDDNITYVTTDEKADFYTTLSLGLGAKYEGKRLSFDISGDLNQDIFYKYNNFNNMNEDATLNLQCELSRYDTLNLRNTFTHDYEPRSFESAFGRIGGRYSYYWNDLDIALTHEITKQLLLSGRYANYASFYDRSELSDSIMNSVGAQIQYALSSATNFFLSYDYSVRTFSGGGSPYLNMISTGFRQYLTKKLYTEAYGGVQFIKSYGGGSTTKPYYKVSLIGDLDENTVASLSYINETSIVSYSRNNFARWRVSTDISRKLAQRLWGSASAFYGEGEYEAVDITNNFAGISAGFTYDVSKDIKVSVNYTYSNNDSNDISDDYTKNVYKIGIRGTF